MVGADEPDPLQHGLVVEGLLDRADAVLPVRFGERFATEDELAEAVAPRLEALEAQLDHVAGCVEVGVRDRPARRAARTATTAPDTCGHALREQLAADEVHRALAAQRPRQRADEPRRRVPRRPRRRRRLLSRREQLLASHPALDVLCTGPWAPYSFAAAT